MMICMVDDVCIFGWLHFVKKKLILLCKFFCFYEDVDHEKESRSY